MATIDIPAGDKLALQLLWSLDDTVFNRFSSALESVGPHLSLYRTCQRVKDFGVEGLSGDQIDNLIRMLRGLLFTASTNEVETEQFVDEICSSAQQADFQDVSSWADSQERLLKLLRPDSKFALAAKAYAITQEQPNTVCTTRISTELLTVFSDDNESVLATIPSHTLCLVYHGSGGHGRPGTRELFVTLDQDDIILLQDALERALAKERALTSFTVKALTTPLSWDT